MSQTTTTFADAALRIGVTEEEIPLLIQQGKITESSPGRIDLESIYTYTGLGRSTHQMKKRGRKPETMSLSDAAKFLNVNIKEVYTLINRVEISLYEPGSLRTATVKTYQKKREGQESHVTPPKEKKKPKKPESKNETPTPSSTPPVQEELPPVEAIAQMGGWGHILTALDQSPQEKNPLTRMAIRAAYLQGKVDVFEAMLGGALCDA